MEILKINGQSMFPTLRHKDRVLVKRLSLHQIKPLDIILFNKDSRIICHRVVKIFKDSDNKVIFYTKGDCNFKSMERVYEEEILGKAVGVFNNKRIRPLRLEHTHIYYLFIRLISFVKVALQWYIERICFFPPIRRLLKILFPLKIDYFIVNTENLDEDFKSFYNPSPFLDREQYDILYRLLAIHKNNPAGKLWVLQEKNSGDILLYGPCVKVLYRGRNIGTDLIKWALDLICTKIKKECVYAFVMPNKDILSRLFYKFGFVLAKQDAFPFKAPPILKKGFFVY